MTKSAFLCGGGNVSCPKAGHKNLLSDDVKLKLAEHISSDLDVRYILLIPGKRNKQHVTAELLALINDYLNSQQMACGLHCAKC